MAGYLGDYPTNFTPLVDAFGTYAASTGAPTATTNFAAGDVLIYKDGSDTQRSSSAGITVTTTFDSLTGIQMISIDLSDNTDAGFYAAGHEYSVVVGPITVDGQTLYFPAFSFSIERAGGVLALLKAGTAKVDVTKWLTGTIPAVTTTGVPLVDTKYVTGTLQTARDIGASVLLSSGTGTGQVKLASGYIAPNWGDVGNPTTTVGLSGTTVKTATDVETDTQDIQSRLPAALTAGGNIKAGVQGFLDTVFTEGASGRIAGAFKQFFNIATPAATMDHGILVDTATTLTNAPSDSSGVTTLLSRLSALRAGYLDNLSAGAVALETSLQTLITTVGAAGAGLTATVTAVWAVATRVLTAGTNIVLAKGVGVTGFNDVSTAQVNTEVDTALSDVGLTGTVTGRIDAAITTRAVAGDAMTLTSGERNSTADALLNRDMSTGTDSGSPTVRTVRQALRFLRNKWVISAGTLTVKKEDDSTTSWTGSVTTASGNPVDSIDPAS